MKDIKKYFKKKSIKKINYQFIIIASIITYFTIRVHRFSLTLGDKISPQVALMFYLFYFAALIALITCFKKEFNVSGIENEYNIYSMDDQTRLKGSFSGGFILGCGSVSGNISEEDYYIFYKETDFGYKKDKILCNSVELIMRNDIKPSYKEIWIDGEIKKFIFIPLNSIKKQIKL